MRLGADVVIDYKKDNFEKSVEEYQRAAELAPDSGKYRKNLKKAKDLLEDIQSIKNRGKK